MTSGKLWPIGIVLVLGTTVVANLLLMKVAGSDPSFVIESDYYAKAVAWDSTLAQVKRNDVLGWHLTPTLSAFTPRSGATLTAALTDSSGVPITDAVVKVSAFYNARAGTVFDARLARSVAGYETSLPVNHAGQWELRFDVTRGTQHYTEASRLDAVAR
jgi:nitrogen fixation protein FixH